MKTAALPGQVPNAFQALLSSDFNMSYISANPLMFDREMLPKNAAAISSPEKEPTLKKPKVQKPASSKMTSP